VKEKMTSGEIAKQAGVSTKALRIYDEKGLLKPVGLSEGNYKLYDKSSLIILEKIIALKHIGFSLEEIKSSLENDEQSSIREILEKQLEMMNQKIYELQKAAKCIESAIARFDENPDWDDIADIIRKMEMSQGRMSADGMLRNMLQTELSGTKRFLILYHLKKMILFLTLVAATAFYGERTGNVFLRTSMWKATISTGTGLMISTIILKRTV